MIIDSAGYLRLQVFTNHLLAQSSFCSYDSRICRSLEAILPLHFFRAACEPCAGLLAVRRQRSRPRSPRRPPGKRASRSANRYGAVPLRFSQCMTLSPVSFNSKYVIHSYTFLLPDVANHIHYLHHKQGNPGGCCVCCKVTQNARRWAAECSGCICMYRMVQCYVSYGPVYGLVQCMVWHHIHLL